MYDANIFASIFDVIRPDARGKAAGLMNMVGWLGGGTAPLAVGYVAMQTSLGTAIMLAAAVYVLGSLLLVVAIIRTQANARMIAGR
jgi:nitrate/nitrite transporter NarK